MTFEMGQRTKAISAILAITELTFDDVSEYDDNELGQFLYELGYDWDTWDKEWVPKGAEVEA